jgi:hypothetical protein
MAYGALEVEPTAKQHQALLAITSLPEWDIAAQYFYRVRDRVRDQLDKDCDELTTNKLRGDSKRLAWLAGLRKAVLDAKPTAVTAGEVTGEE